VRKIASMAAMSEELALSKGWKSYDCRPTSVCSQRPIGVVAVVAPAWSPMLFWAKKVPMILAAGCTVVYKPSSSSSLSALRLGELAAEVGIPGGVINIVTGSRADLGGTLVRHPNIDMLDFTGSTASCKSICAMAYEGFKYSELYMGAKSTAIVLEDADADLVASGLVLALFERHGQVSSAGCDIYVDRKLFAEVVAALESKIGQLRVGSASALSTDLGPMVSKRHLHDFHRQVENGIRIQGLEILTGGTVTRLSGYYSEPTLLATERWSNSDIETEDDSALVSVRAFEDVDEVISRINISPRKSGASLWGKNSDKIHSACSKILLPDIWINSHGAECGLSVRGGGSHLHDPVFLDCPEFRKYVTYKTVISENA